MPSRPPSDAGPASDHRNKQLRLRLREALASGRLIEAIELLLQAGNTGARAPTSPGHHATKSGGAHRGYRPGGLAPGEMPRRGLGPGLAAGTVALLAIAAWLLLSNG